jgi:hypothetical protein
VIVVLSILLQGLSIGRLIRVTAEKPAQSAIKH